MAAISRVGYLHAAQNMEVARNTAKQNCDFAFWSIPLFVNTVSAKGSARIAARADLANLQRQLTSGVLKLSPAINDLAQLITEWESHHEKALIRMSEVMVR